MVLGNVLNVMGLENVADVKAEVIFGVKNAKTMMVNV